MDAIEWDDSYSVGVPELDEQHKNLFRIVNTMFSTEDLSVNSKVITDLMAEMAAELEQKIARQTAERDMLKAQFEQLGPDLGFIPINR